MDQQTLVVYEEQADAIFSRHVTHGRHAQQELILTHLHAGGRTADVGSGSGILLDWLVGQGFAAIGFEPVRALRQLSIESFPGIELRDSSLPALPGVEDQIFDNVVFTAVLMHLPLDSIAPSIANLTRILRNGGRLLLSYRTSNNQQDREDDGQLFTRISADLFDQSLLNTGLDVIAVESNEDQNRPGSTFTTVIAEKSAV